MKILFALCLAWGLSLSAAAQTILNEEFWAELQPLVPQGEQTVSMDTAVKRILEEGRYVFSGMIFGFSFSYVPSDRSRNIGEEFELEPVFQIPPGDPCLFVYQTRREGSRVYARLRYRLRDFQEDWYQGTLSNLMRSSAGSGESSCFAGYEEKMTAIRNSVKSAVREYARTRIDNKPRKVTGTVFLDGAPRIEIQSGSFKALSAVRLMIDDVISYGAY
jgi:hypothetical protein